MIRDADRAIALNYAPAAKRQALAALWMLDEALGQIVASTTEPLIGQMRLTWWHERLCGLDAGERAAEPLLTALVADVLSHDVTGAELAAMVEGWEALLEPMPLADEVLESHARGRGRQLFVLSLRVLGLDGDPLPGEGWALADFARRCSGEATRARALAMATLRLPGGPLPKPLRILANLAKKRLSLPVDAQLSRWGVMRAVLR